jgi:DNA-binding transcriptional ArsR family regulator
MARNTAAKPDCRALAGRMKMVNDPTRVEILMILEGGERNASELQDEMGIESQPALTHHLRILRAGGMITDRRQNKFCIYRLTESGLSTIIGIQACMNGAK